MKPGAPVDVQAELSNGAARLWLRFDAAATDVKLDVRGADGLVVTSAPEAGWASVAQGEVKVLDVAFKPADGAQLVVGVKGVFGGGPLVRVVTFAVGALAPAAGPGEVITTSDGDRVRAIPLGD